MKADLLDLVCCPGCHGEIQDLDRLVQITDGTLSCKGCGAVYPVHKGIPYLYIEDGKWQTKAREINGWIDLVKEKGIYDQIVRNEDSFKLPYLHDLADPRFAADPWVITAKFFDAALDLMQLRGGETVLDMGAGQGWAAKHFALRGCRVVATDILADDHVGLGRGNAIMERAQTSFELAMGDNENLPFREGAFDIVFACNSLHHTRDMSSLLRNVWRVLKPGGRLIASSEPCISLLAREEDLLDNSEEVQHGITEARPNVLQYFRQLKRAGFQDVRMNNLHTYWTPDTELYGWLEQELRTWRGAVRPAARPIAGLAAGVIKRLPRKWAVMAFLGLRNDLIVLDGRKPARPGKPDRGS